MEIRILVIDEDVDLKQNPDAAKAHFIVGDKDGRGIVVKAFMGSDVMRNFPTVGEAVNHLINIVKGKENE